MHQATKKRLNGLHTSPCAAVGQIVFSSEDADEWKNAGEKVVLVRVETSPEDVGGILLANSILTARRGMTSHAAVVAPDTGKCCICSVSELKLEQNAENCTAGKMVRSEDDFVTLKGGTSEAVESQTPLVEAGPTDDFKKLMDMCDKYRTLCRRANADTPHDCRVANRLGAGVWPCAGLSTCSAWATVLMLSAR